MDLIVDPSGSLACGGLRFRCALGRGGVRTDKHEGDGATPAGAFPLLALYIRADRMRPPASALPAHALVPSDGWCDDPTCPDYNRLVALPHAGSHERLWRDDGLYDMLVVIGYNDSPVVAGRGSAIFLHVAAPDFSPTEGCVALTHDALVQVVALCDTTSIIRIMAPG